MRAPRIWQSGETCLCEQLFKFVWQPWQEGIVKDSMAAGQKPIQSQTPAGSIYHFQSFLSGDFGRVVKTSACQADAFSLHVFEAEECHR